MKKKNKVTLAARTASVVRAAIRFEAAWSNSSLTDGHVYDAAMGVMRAVWRYRGGPRRSNRKKVSK